MKHSWGIATALQPALLSAHGIHHGRQPLLEPASSITIPTALKILHNSAFPSTMVSARAPQYCNRQAYMHQLIFFFMPPDSLQINLFFF